MRWVSVPPVIRSNPQLLQLGCERLRVADDLVAVVAEVGRRGLVQGDADRGRGVVVGTALEGGEDGAVDGGGVLGPAEDHRAAGAAQGLVGGGHDHVRVRRGVGVGAGDDEAGGVRDVGEEVGADFLRDLSEGREVELAGVSGATGDDDPRLLVASEGAESVVVDEVGLRVDGILHCAVEARGEVYLPAVAEVPAVRQREAHDGVAGLEEGVVDSHVRGRA